LLVHAYNSFMWAIFQVAAVILSTIAAYYIPLAFFELAEKYKEQKSKFNILCFVALLSICFSLGLPAYSAALTGHITWLFALGIHGVAIVFYFVGGFLTGGTYQEQFIPTMIFVFLLFLLIPAIQKARERALKNNPRAVSWQVAGHSIPKPK
jgi:hypothetical protein